MKVISFNVPKVTREAFRLQVDRVSHFYDKLHQHPETQIMYIVRGEGTLIAGDYVGRFQSGDLFLIGSGQAHVFRNDDLNKRKKKKEAHAISVYFDENYAGSSFWQLDELKQIRHLLEQAKRGFRARGETRFKAIEYLKKMIPTSGIDKLILFLELLRTLSVSKELQPLSVSIQYATFNTGEGKRMNDILNFTFQQSHREIYLEEVAAIANLSVEAFCRYFKTRTRKTYTGFLNEVRVSKACHLLIGTDKTIYEVAVETGFANISHFNRVFKRIKGETPSRFLENR